MSDGNTTRPWGSTHLYMSSTGICATVMTPFLTWPMPKTPFFFEPLEIGNNEIIYSQYICQCCGKIGSFLEWESSRFTRKRVLFFNTNISVIGVGFSLGEHSYILCCTWEWGGHQYQKTYQCPRTSSYMTWLLIHAFIQRVQNNSMIAYLRISGGQMSFRLAM